MILRNEVERRFIQSVGLISALCLSLLVGRLIISGTSRYIFIPGNLALAWLALLFAWLLVKELKTQKWLRWQNIALTVLWLIFLPNTWYVLTDFLHVYATGEISELYDIVMMSTLVMSGFILGFTSLYLVHQELRKRLSEQKSAVLVGLVILLASFGIYLGRVLRWNTWDVITNPSGIILNVSDRIIDPFGHPRAFNVTALLFVLICSVYFAIWNFVRPHSKR